MSLQIWLPLNGDLHNQGLSDLTFTNTNSSTITINNNGKIGQCYERATAKSGGYIVSNTDILFDKDISICCWVKVTNTVGNTANGLVSMHSHSNNTGFALCVKYISTTDYRICCSTGNGTGRTYYTYYGTTNIKDSWHHLALTYDNTLHVFKLWVDGICEKIQNYTNAARADIIKIFDWSTTNDNNHYQPACSLNDVRIYDHALSDKEVEEIAKGLVLHYKLDGNWNGEENICYDSSGYGNNGTIIGSLSTIADTARYNCATYFADGVNEHIVIDSTNFPKDNITMNIWFKTSNITPTGNHHAIFGKIQEYQITLRGTDGHLFLAFHINGTLKRKEITNKNYIDGLWHMVTTVYTGTNIQFFVDGELVSHIDNISGNLSSIDNFYIGYGNYSTTIYGVKECYLSDARIYATALTAAQIKELYNTSATIDNLGNAYARELVE